MCARSEIIHRASNKVLIHLLHAVSVGRGEEILCVQATLHRKVEGERESNQRYYK